jgi:hypothetical protein
MSADFLHPSYGGRNSAPVAPAPEGPRPGPVPAAGNHDVNCRAARLAGRACCCSARPVVIAVMGTAVGRPHRTDLLLCLHHYRASRAGLATAGATVLDLDGRPVADTAWPDVP